MGVHGLWELVAPVGRRVSVETLAGKTLAIDASIWMVQFMKAMRDEKGEMVRNAHLIGFFRRICKLLYLRTKPVFVFDGGTPALKRRTVIARRRQRENAQAKIRKTAEKLLLNHLKAVKLKELAKDLENQRQQQKKNDSKGKRKRLSGESTQTDIGSNVERTDQEKLYEMLAATIAAEKDGLLDNEVSASADVAPSEEEDGNEDEEMILKNDAKGKKILSDDGCQYVAYDQQKLDEMLAASIAAEEDGGLTNNASTSGAAIPLEEEDDDEDEEMLLPAMHGNVDPAVLAALPPSMQLDLLVQMRERLMAENRQKYQKVKKAPEKFSELQIQAYLKTVAFRREIDEVQKAAAGRGVCGVQTSRIASEANREFIFSSSFTGDKQVLTSARVEGNGEKQQNTPSKHHSSDSMNAVASISKSNAVIGLGPDESRTFDDDVETYLDELGRVRVSRHRAMGIRMTRDLQRNLDLMKEVDNERTVASTIANVESMPNRGKTGTPKKFSSKNQFVEISQDGTVESVNLNDKHEQSMLNNGTSIEISFEDDGENKSFDDDDDIFARLAAGVPVTISSAENAPRKQSSFSTSDCEWKEVPIEVKHHSFVDDANSGIRPSLHECNISDEGEVEWEETPCDSLKNYAVFPTESGEIVSRGHLQEEADLQEAIRRSLLDLGGEESNYVLSEPELSKKPRDFLDEENNTVGPNLLRENGTRQKESFTEIVDVVKKVDSAGGVNISQTIDSSDRQLKSSAVHDSYNNDVLISKPCENFPCSHSEQSGKDATEWRNLNREMPYAESVFPSEAKKVHFLLGQCLDDSNHDGLPAIASRCSRDSSHSFNAVSVDMLDAVLVDNEKNDSEAEPSVLFSDKENNIEAESSILVDDKRNEFEPELFQHSGEMADPSNPLVESSRNESTFDIDMEQKLADDKRNEFEPELFQHSGEMADPSNPLVESSRNESTFDIDMEQKLAEIDRNESSILVDDKRNEFEPELFQHSGEMADPSNPLVESSRNESTFDIDMEQKLAAESSHEKQFNEMEHNIDTAIKDDENVQVEFTEASLEEEMLILDQERMDLGDEQRRLERNAESVSSEMFAECQELLQIFGLPYIIAPMEAEAQCAYMELTNLVDGVVTDDSDVFLFGARSVYKNIFDDRKYVETYFMKDIEKDLGLSREKLIRIALLLGSDYTEGVSGIGIVNAIEVVNAFPEEDGLQKFREWIESPDPTILGKFNVQTVSSVRKRGSKVGNNDMTSSVEGVSAFDQSILQADESQQTADDIQDIKQIFMDTHRNVSKNWHIPSSFPSEAVISAYSCPQVDKSTDPFSWGKPDLFVLRKLCWEKFGWNGQKTDELLLPVLKEYEKRETQLRLEAFYTFNERFAKIRSKRIKKAVKGITGNQASELVDDTLQIVSKSRKKGRVSSVEGGDKKLEEPLLKTEESVGNQKNSMKKSTPKQSRKRGTPGKLVSSERGLEPPLMAGSNRSTNKGSHENRRVRGRGRGRGRGIRTGKRKVGLDFELSETSTDGTSGDDGQKVYDENLERPQEVRRSSRSRNPVNYNVNDLEVDDTSKSPRNKECTSEEAVEQDLFGAQDILDGKKQREALDPLFKEGVCAEYLQTGGGFCTDEGEIGQPSVSQNSYPYLEDDFSNDYLEKGGGFCTGGSEVDKDKDAADNPDIIGKNADYSAGFVFTDEADHEVGSAQSFSRPKRNIDTFDTELNLDHQTATKNDDDSKGVPLRENVQNDTWTTSAGALSAMPFLKKKRKS